MELVKHPGFTEAEFRVLGEYIRDTADLVGLRDWHLTLMHEPPDSSEAAAQMQVTYGKRRAQIWVANDFRTYEAERQRQYVVHELVHIFLDGIDTLCRNEFRTMIGETIWNSWYPGVKLVFENGVDALAEALAPRAPLIAWPQPPKKPPRRRRG